jgi:hypothetical protein
MKFALITLFSLFLALSCAKSDSTPDQGSAPNMSPAKHGDSAGDGTGSSLGSESPSH